MRRLLLVLVAVGLVVGGSVAVVRGSTGSTKAGCAAHWRVVASGPTVPSFRGVAVVSLRDVWVVGGTSGSGATRPVIVHWDGRALRVVPAFEQVALARSFALRAITAVSADDVWAVGSHGTDARRPVVVHWDGRRWQPVPTPELSGEADLDAAAALSASDVWAVGSVGTFPRNRALVMHWDGRGWRIWTLDGPASSLSAIDGASSHDLWAVGDANENGPQIASEEPLAVHWNGQTWQGSRAFSGEMPNAPWVVGFDSIDVRSASDVWTVANDEVEGASDVLHWNGHRERLVYQYTGSGSLADLAVVNSSDIWAVGLRFEPHRPTVVHWAGTSWQIEKTPLDDLRGSDLWSLSIRSPKDIWAVGDHLIARYSC